MLSIITDENLVWPYNLWILLLSNESCNSGESSKGQPADLPPLTLKGATILERTLSWSHTQISILLTIFLTHFKETLYDYFSCLIK